MKHPEDEDKTVRFLARSHYRALSVMILNTYLEIIEQHHDFRGIT